MAPSTRLRPVSGFAALAATVVLVTGCSIGRSSSGDLDTRSGCELVVAERSVVGTDVVLNVDATGCHDADDGQVPERLTGAAWRSLALPVDAVHVSVSETWPAAGPPMIVSSEDLAERFGPGPHGTPWPILEDRPDEGLWPLLPLSYVVVALAMVFLARRLRRAGVIVVLVRR